MTTLNTLREIIDRADPEELEGARDLIRPEHIKPLVDLYDALGEDLDRQCALIDLLQDHPSPTSRPLMARFLRETRHVGTDQTRWSRAVAICHLEGSFDGFSVYFGDDAAREAAEQRTLSDAPAAW